MFSALLFVFAVFTVGFGVMIKELMKAPVAYEDAKGFHLVANEPSNNMTRQTPARSRRVRRHVASPANVASFEHAHAQ